MFWRRKVHKVPTQRLRLSLFDSFVERELRPGESLTIQGICTLWAGGDGVLDIGPPMTDEQMQQRTARELYASHGVTLKVVEK